MVTQATYREAMSRLGAAVNVITSRGLGGLAGATACAVCSVTDEPPSLLVCLNRKARSNEIIKANGVLCVNVLTSDQEELSLRFSGQSGGSVEDRFAATEWDTLATGAPVIHGALASFDCEVEQTLEVGTHTVFISRVVDLTMSDASRGLVYFTRRYTRIGHSDL
jgi:flavin reductase